MEERVRGDGGTRQGSREKEVLVGRQQHGGLEDLVRPGAVVQGDVEEEELDPRVQDELEKLNHCTDEINRLEIQLDDANTVFRSLLSDSTHHLKVGTCQSFFSRPFPGSVEKDWIPHRKGSPLLRDPGVDGKGSGRVSEGGSSVPESGGYSRCCQGARGLEWCSEDCSKEYLIIVGFGWALSQP